MDVPGIIETTKALSDVTSPLLALVILLYLFYFKNKEVRLDSAEKIGKLQSDQLEILIKQNQELSIELHTVRQELTAAYAIISDMRNRVQELEQLINYKTHASTNVTLLTQKGL